MKGVGIFTSRADTNCRRDDHGKRKKLKSGNWRVLEYDYTDENNKRHYKSFTASTKKEAEYMAKEYSHNKQRGAKTYNDLTLQEAYRRYIDSKSSVLAPSTIDGYEKICEMILKC